MIKEEKIKYVKERRNQVWRPCVNIFIEGEDENIPKSDDLYSAAFDIDTELFFLHLKGKIHVAFQEEIYYLHKQISYSEGISHMVYYPDTDIVKVYVDLV
jgi:hypothetical protein